MIWFSIFDRSVSRYDGRILVILWVCIDKFRTYFGIAATRTSHGLFLFHTTFVKEILSHVEISIYNTCSILIDTKHKFPSLVNLWLTQPFFETFSVFFNIWHSLFQINFVWDSTNLPICVWSLQTSLSCLQAILRYLQGTTLHGMYIR